MLVVFLLKALDYYITLPAVEKGVLSGQYWAETGIISAEFGKAWCIYHGGV